MKVIEKQIVAKTGRPETCEDYYVVNEHFVCVIDGATNVSGRLIDGKTPGQLISQLIGQVMQDMPEQAEIEQIIATINEELTAYYRKQGIYEELAQTPYLAPAASMVIYSSYHKMIWLVGDCQCMVDNTTHTNPKEIDDITAAARSLFLESEIQRGRTVEELLEKDTGFEFIMPLIQKQYFLQNKEGNQYGYEVVNGFSMLMERIKAIPVPADAEHLIFASDGYPELRDNLIETEEYLKEILATDPLCFRKYKSAKGLQRGYVSFDDRTYIKVAL
ncbi:hypothetical protein [Bacillus horti]|uniref:Glycerophosphoryl diester phosphodiesterase n=1 Tax=Caldalkalibacillus horti TaxID=77523 RepID=A0ABT9W5N5_9BACI|nr:hypothetical protein [Bacillus horti]MDQ0168379.1 glycerophosphoryl diester phosphodiesterase [Bacillus horti]